MTAGSIAVPTIIPLRPPVSGQSKYVIDSNTKIELRTNTENAVIYYTLNGTKPDPFQKVTEKCTLQYRGPFTLPPGKRVVKAIAMSKDGIRESHPNTKSFDVGYVNPPKVAPVDDDFVFQEDLHEELTRMNTKRAAKDLILSSKSAWTNVGDISATQMVADMNIDGEDHLHPRRETRFLNSRNARRNSPERRAGEHSRHYEKRQLPDSSSQLDRLERETDVIKYLNNHIDPHSSFYKNNPQTAPRPIPHKPGQMGTCVYCRSTVPFNTTSCVVCEGPIPVDSNEFNKSIALVPTYPDQSRLAVPPPGQAQYPLVSSDFRTATYSVATQTVGLFYPSTREMDKKKEKEAEKDAYEKQMRDRRPLLTAISPGKGYWRRQIDHICQHLKAHGQNNAEFRALVGEPRMGKLITSAIQEDGYELNMTLTFAIRGKHDPLTGKKLGITGDYLSLHTERDSLADSFSDSEENEVQMPHSHRKKTVRKPRMKRKTPKVDPMDAKLLKQLGPDGEGEVTEVQLLIDEGANPDCTNRNGLPALHVAVKSKRVECIQVLFQAGCDVNKKGPAAIKGNTALHEAVNLGPAGLAVVEVLLECGADQNKKNDKGDSPYNLAVKSGYESIATKFAAVFGQSQLNKLLKSKSSSSHLAPEY